jgi:hypothetical protein
MAISSIDQASANPPAIAWRRVANEKMQQLVVATDGAPVKRVTEVAETQLYQLRGGRVTVTDISQSTATVDVKV